MIEQTNDLFPAENMVLVPKDEYDRLIRCAAMTESFAEIATEEWAEGARRGYGGITPALQTLIRVYNPTLYKQTRARAAEAEEAYRKEQAENTRKRFGNLGKGPHTITTADPYPANVPVYPPQYPYNGIEITCCDAEKDRSETAAACQRVLGGSSTTPES